MHRGIVRLLVDPHHKGSQPFSAARCRDYHLLGPCVEVCLGFFRILVYSRCLDYDINSKVAPVKLVRGRMSKSGYGLAVHEDIFVVVVDFSLIPPMNRIVLEKVGSLLRGRATVCRHYVYQPLLVVLMKGSEDQSSYSTKTVNCDFHLRHGV